MLGVGSSIWNRALAGKGAGNGGNPPSGSYLWTESFEDATNDTGLDYTRATTQYVETDTGNLYPVPAGAIPIQKARPARNLAASSDTPSTQNITVVVGHVYAVRIGAESASGATAVCSGAFTGTLTGDAAAPYALNGVATTTTLTVTITGSIRKLQVQDITHRSALSTAPDEYVDSATDHGTGVNGFRYFTTALANTVDGSGVVTEGTGAALTGIALANVPGATNLCRQARDFSNAVWSLGTATYAAATRRDGIAKFNNLIDDNAGGTESLGQQVAVAANTAPLTLSVEVPKTSSASTFPYIGITPAGSGSSNGVFINTDNGTLTDRAGLAPDDSQIISVGDFWKVAIQKAGVNSANCLIALVPAGNADASDDFDATVTGSCDFCFLNLYQDVTAIEAIGLPPIDTADSTASTDSAVLDFSGVTGFTTPNETRVVATGLNASLEADPTDTTERNVDADDWSGTDLSDLVPHGNIISVTQYAPGERP